MVDGVELWRDEALPDAEVGGLGAFVYEPDGAITRAGLLGELARMIRGARIHPGVSYLTASAHTPTAFATAFEVLEVMPWSERVLRQWVRELAAAEVTALRGDRK